MRSQFLAASLAAAVLLPLSAVTAASASRAVAHDVLTTGRVGGHNVKLKDVLQAGLAGGSIVVVSNGTQIAFICTQSTFKAKVTKNPTAPGIAISQLIGLTITKCKPAGIRPVDKTITLTLVNLPIKTTASDKKGHPVTVFGPLIKIAVTLTTGGSFSCTYGAKTVAGSFSNTHQAITFNKQTLTKVSGRCNRPLVLTATYGPVVDLNVAGHPHVFVN